MQPVGTCESLLVSKSLSSKSSNNRPAPPPASRQCRQCPQCLHTFLVGLGSHALSLLYHSIAVPIDPLKQQIQFPAQLDRVRVRVRVKANFEQKELVMQNSDASDNIQCAISTDLTALSGTLTFPLVAAASVGS